MVPFAKKGQNTFHRTQIDPTGVTWELVLSKFGWEIGIDSRATVFFSPARGPARVAILQRASGERGPITVATDDDRSGRGAGSRLSRVNPPQIAAEFNLHRNINTRSHS